MTKINYPGILAGVSVLFKTKTSSKAHSSFTRPVASDLIQSGFTHVLSDYLGPIE